MIKNIINFIKKNITIIVGIIIIIALMIGIILVHNSNESVNNQMVDLKQEITTLTAENNALQEENEILNKTNDSLGARVGELIAEQELLNIKIKDLETEINSNNTTYLVTYDMNYHRFNDYRGFGHASFAIPVSKEYYNSVEIGDRITDFVHIHDFDIFDLFIIDKEIVNQ